MSEPDKKPLAWPTLSREQREAMVVLVRDSLAAMANNVESWLPTALEAPGPDRLVVELDWHITDVDTHVAVLRHRAEAARDLRIGDLRHIAGLDDVV